MCWKPFVGNGTRLSSQGRVKQGLDTVPLVLDCSRFGLKFFCGALAQACEFLLGWWGTLREKRSFGTLLQSLTLHDSKALILHDLMVFILHDLTALTLHDLKALILHDLKVLTLHGLKELILHDLKVFTLRDLKVLTWR
jgi:hypothetical protein